MRPAQHVSRAKYHLVVGVRATESAGGVILGVAISVRAPILEEGRVVGRHAVVGRRSSAAVLVLLEDGAGVVAAAGHPQLVGALSQDVCVAGDPPAAALRRVEGHGDVEPVYHRDVKEVKIVELVQRILGQSVGWLPKSFAGQKPAAVAGLATAMPAAVEVATGAAPYACHLGTGVDKEFQDWPGSSCWPPPGTAAAHTV